MTHAQHVAAVVLLQGFDDVSVHVHADKGTHTGGDQRLQLVQLRPQAAGKIHHSLSCVAVLFAHPDGRALALGGLGILSDGH